VRVGRLRSTVAADAIAIGSVADRCLLSGIIQTSHFKGVRTVFDPNRTCDTLIGVVPVGAWTRQTVAQWPWREYRISFLGR